MTATYVLNWLKNVVVFAAVCYTVSTIGYVVMAGLRGGAAARFVISGICVLVFSSLLASFAAGTSWKNLRGQMFWAMIMSGMVGATAELLWPNQLQNLLLPNLLKNLLS